MPMSGDSAVSAQPKYIRILPPRDLNSDRSGLVASSIARVSPVRARSLSKSNLRQSKLGSALAEVARIGLAVLQEPARPGWIDDPEIPAADLLAQRRRIGPGFLRSR